jgi:peptide/nickel transport system substrate-binding protein
MKLGKWTKAMVGALALVMCLAPMALAGGVLKVAVSDEPPALDQQVITSDLATMIAQHMFEGLYTFDSTYKPVPMLAEGADVKNDGKLISLKLRQGVKFHNGSEMTSADVVASLQRWGNFGSRGPVLFATIEKVEAAGKYQVDLYFKEVFGPWQSMLAFINGGPVIHPKAIMEKADKKPIDIKDYIRPFCGADQV